MVIRYVSVGAVCALLNLAIMFFGHQVAGLHYLLAALLTCLITIPLSYCFHLGFTFKHSRLEEIDRYRFARFVASQLVQFAAGLLLLMSIVELGGMEPMWAMFSVTLLMFIYGFVASSTWVFRALGSGRS